MTLVARAYFSSKASRTKKQNKARQCELVLLPKALETKPNYNEKAG